ncbi:MAG: hypothetical protein C0594_07485, partial [Marinilabiliales bacterium]
MMSNEKEVLSSGLEERAKELSCLYEVDELLKDTNEEVHFVLKALTKVIPKGWKFPEICEVEITY